VRLEQIITNLINNAARYTPPNGHIAVTVVRESGDAVLRVIDNGVGIPAHVLPRVFDLFAQAERSPARSEGGLGIGLTVVKKLVDGHGGTVTATSDGPGLGSQFAVRLPIGNPRDVPTAVIGLPGFDGYEVARRVRSEHGNAIRLVAMTGYGQAEDHIRAEQAGFDVHLVKPVPPEHLRHAVASPQPHDGAQH